MSTQTDRELLELAAKAAGVVFDGFDEYRGCDVWWLPDQARYDAWNPLESDSDALRLAVQLRIDLSLWIRTDQVSARHHAGDNWISLRGPTKPQPQREHSEPRGDDEYAATRRAITRAAASIGESKS